MKTWTIGSGKQNDLVIDDAAVEGHHAEIQLEGAQIIVRDLNSAKGTFVNDWQVRQKVILPNDKLSIGDRLIDIDALINTAPKIWSQEPVSVKNSRIAFKTNETKEQAASLLGVSIDAPIEDILLKYNKEHKLLTKLRADTPLPNQKKAYSEQLKALTDAKNTLLDGIDLSNLPVKEPVNTKPSNTIPNLTPEKKSDSDNQDPKKWYHNYPLLWGSIAALLAWSVFLMYERFADNQARLTITEVERMKYDFLDKNFKPRAIQVRNISNKPFTILTFTAITYDSTAKGWEFQKPVEQVINMEVNAGKIEKIPVIKNAVMVSLFIRNEDGDFQFSRLLSPESADFNAAGYLEVKAP
jgi:hypothetical protein